jgi:hypothetical protein
VKVADNAIKKPIEHRRTSSHNRPKSCACAGEDGCQTVTRVLTIAFPVGTAFSTLLTGFKTCADFERPANKPLPSDG